MTNTRVSSFVDPSYYLNNPLCYTYEKDGKKYTKVTSEKIIPVLGKNDTYFNENILSVLYEDPEELEFGGYNCLCDTALYYFIDDFEEFDADLVYDDEEEYLEDDEEEELDFTGDFDFVDFCASIGIKLPRFDEALITYKE